MSGRILVGDARRELRSLPDASVDMVLTSPAYFRLRDYQMPGQLGLELDIGGWTAELRGVCRQLARILTPTGTLWLNLGDSFSTHPRQGTGRKSLLLGPERLAIALVRDGWLLRNKIVWRKSNAMPTSRPDRLACTWEALYVFAKNPSYFFDLDAIREPHRSRIGTDARKAGTSSREAWRGPNSSSAAGLAALKAAGLVGHPLGRNPGDVWTTASSNYRSSHHATFPDPLVERAVTAGCPELRCSICLAPWRRLVVRHSDGTAERRPLEPTCSCHAPSEPGLVLDPFIGSGTTAVVADRLGRDWLGIELSPSFAAEAEARIRAARAVPKARAA